MDVMRFDPFGAFVSPLSLVLLGGLAWLYMRGANRPRLMRERVGPVRHGFFVLAVFLLALAFDGPLAGAGQRLFFAHQVQHLTIRLLGPFLIALAHPWPVLRAGLPRGLRRWLGRVSGSRPVRGAARRLSRLDVSFVLLIASLYVWQVPALHNAAVAMPSLALFAHICMVFAGLNFFVATLDRRDGPEHANHRARILALVGVILSNILLGSLTTMKESLLYTAYDTAGRLWGFSPMVDESTGGYTIWVPSSFIIIAAIMVVFNGWNRAEVRRWNMRHSWSGSNAAALDFPQTAQELRLKVAAPNRRLGRTLALISATMFVTVLITGATIIYVY